MLYITNYTQKYTQIQLPAAQKSLPKIAENSTNFIQILSQKSKICWKINNFHSNSSTRAFSENFYQILLITNK